MDLTPDLLVITMVKKMVSALKFSLKSLFHLFENKTGLQLVFVRARLSFCVTAILFNCECADAVQTGWLFILLYAVLAANFEKGLL